MDDWSTQDGVERGRDVGLYEEEEDFLVRNCEAKAGSPASRERRSSSGSSRYRGRNWKKAARGRISREQDGMDDWSTQDGVERGRDVGLYEEEEDFLVRNCSRERRSSSGSSRYRGRNWKKAARGRISR
jgi:hypothetical protein